MVRWCWVSFQYRGALLIWIRVGQGLTALAVGAGGVLWTLFLSSIISPFFLPLRETARYRLKYCLKGPLSPKQPTNLMYVKNKVDLEQLACEDDTGTKFTLFLTYVKNVHLACEDEDNGQVTIVSNYIT